MLYWIAYGIPTIILLIALIYAVNRAGWFSPAQGTPTRRQHQDGAGARRPPKARNILTGRASSRLGTPAISDSSLLKERT